MLLFVALLRSKLLLYNTENFVSKNIMLKDINDNMQLYDKILIFFDLSSFSNFKTPLL